MGKLKAFLKDVIPEANINTIKFLLNMNYYYYVDLKNIAKYGFEAPRFAERIWLNPKRCTKALTNRNYMGINRQQNSARVIENEWPFHLVIDINEIPNIKFCFDHWLYGVSWKDTGAYEHIEKLIRNQGKKIDGCLGKGDIIRRYEKLDKIYKQVKLDGKLKTQKELNSKNFREIGGVLIHIGPGGEPYFGGIGHHRFAIAHILNLHLPAQIGCVHIDAIPYLFDYRICN